GWPHHRNGPNGNPRRRSGSLSEPRVQTRCRLRTYWHGQRTCSADRSEKRFSAEGLAGIYRLCEGELQQAQRRPFWCRLDILHHLPAAEFYFGREAATRTLQWRG